jgi:membrane associated rhomboid family serine protease
VGAEVWILLAASALALQLVTTLLRHEHRGEVPYLVIVGINFVVLAAAFAMQRSATAWAEAAAVVAAVLVLAPRLLDRLERGVLARNDLEAALRLARVRELLVPGLASTRRRRQFANLIEARHGGADKVLARLDGELAATREGEAVVTLLLERAVVLFVAGRYRDCIEAAHKVGDDWAAAHPSLAPYVVRAHAELADLGAALAVVEAVEAGPAARDPGALGILTQARMTLLAFAGRQTDIDRLLNGEAGLFLSEEERSFLHDTARDRAAVIHEPAFARKLDGVAERTAESARPLIRPTNRTWVTLALLGAIFVVALFVQHGRLWEEPSPVAIVRWGALWRPAVLAGEWWRLLTALFLHGNWGHLLVNMYALYMLGRFCEDVCGAARYFVIYIVGGLAGAAASTLNTQQGGLSVGASGAIMGLLGALIVVLVLRRGTWPEMWRRALLWNLVLLGAIQIFIGFQLPMVDNAAHVGGMLGGAAAALLFAPGGLLGGSAAARGVIIGLAVVFLGGLVFALVQVARTSLAASIARVPTKLVNAGDRVWRVPSYWEKDQALDIVYDPNFVRSDNHYVMALPPRELPEDPELRHILLTIAKNAPPP